MKKIMFSDAYQLTQAVLDGRKTQTRRLAPKSIFQSEYDIDDDERKIWIEDKYGDWHDVRKSIYCYKVGEVVAVAQSYKDAGVNFIPEEDEEFGCYSFPAEQLAGWINKMFVRADLMPHRIRITDVRVERLNDISESDCRAEGVDSWVCRGKRYYGFFDYSKDHFVRCDTSREAYAALIDRISGKGVWSSNPYVFAYTFELVK